MLLIGLIFHDYNMRFYGITLDSDDSKIATRDSVEKVRRICRNQPNVFLHDFVGFGIDFEGGVKSCEPLE